MGVRRTADAHAELTSKVTNQLGFADDPGVTIFEGAVEGSA
jgi:hypothetical protein